MILTLIIIEFESKLFRVTHSKQTSGDCDIFENVMKDLLSRNMFAHACTHMLLVCSCVHAYIQVQGIHDHPCNLTESLCFFSLLVI